MAARLKNFDYSSPGDYFITIITKNRVRYFGQIITPSIENLEVSESMMMLNEIGLKAHQCLLELNHYFSNAIIDEFIVMPDHVHFILSIKKLDTIDATTKKEFKTNRFSRPVAGSVSVIVQQFKAEVKRWCAIVPTPIPLSLFSANYLSPTRNCGRSIPSRMILSTHRGLRYSNGFCSCGNLDGFARILLVTKRLSRGRISG